ncbi:hypothetical protein LTR84_012579 [Exophiala bonariae]|uniref:Clr5 domain-containing protein n=1 Tax=Exophiala bonariae TaxID=1690606 RepID=A0AAV9NEC1_9EURO|nr:hypothetical protein LTR84_012579 [Exophiala bonariae]
MASPPRRCASRKDWEDQKAEIYERYLVQNLKLNIVTDFLNQQRGFQVTPRQVKAKIKEWSFDNKRTFGHHYRAMLVVADHRRNILGLDTVFLVPKNASTEEVCPARVKKEVDRQRGELRLRLPNFEEAKAALEAGNITWHLPRTENTADTLQFLTSHQNHSDISLSPAADPLWLVTDEADEANSFGYSVPNSPFEPMIGSPATSFGASNTAIESLVNFAEFGMHTGHDIQQYQIQAQAQWTFHTAHQPVMAYAFHDLTATSDVCLSCPSEHQNFDLFDIIQCLGRADESKMHVSQWAGPWLWLAFGNQLGQQTSKEGGMNALRRTLRLQPDNQYVFPCLSGMITVLGAWGKDAELGDFLRASCLVIDEETNQNPIYSSTFHYALAVHQENDVDKRRYGENFARTHEPMKLVWQEDHPNVLVNISFWAFYLLDERKFAEAIALLERYLPSFMDVMGRHDLFTINCRAILSRAYEEVGNYSEASHHLEQALEVIGDQRWVVSAVKLRLQGRLGELKRQMGELSSAEQYLRHCVVGRMELFGLQDAAIWWFIDILCEVLSRSGRNGDIDLLLRDLQQRDDCPQGEIEAQWKRIKYRMRWGRQ